MHFGAIQEFQGLRFTTSVRSDTNVAVVVGRNGAGKTRLLKAISEHKIEIFIDDVVVPPGSARMLTLNELQPSLVFAFDALQHREQQRQAVALYNVHRGKFDSDPQRSIATIGQTHAGRMQVNIHQLAPGRPSDRVSLRAVRIPPVA